MPIIHYQVVKPQQKILPSVIAREDLHHILLPNQLIAQLALYDFLRDIKVL